MQRLESGVLTWDLQKLSEAMVLSPEDVRSYFTDGRRVSFVLERRIAKEVLRGTLASSEGDGYDLVAPDGGKWEVRSLTKLGVYFCPSYMIGSNRKFNKNGFLKKLENISGYIVSNVESFPIVTYWIIPKEYVKYWYENNCLGSGTKVGHSRAIYLFSHFQYRLTLDDAGLNI